MEPGISSPGGGRKVFPIKPIAGGISMSRIFRAFLLFGLLLLALQGCTSRAWFGGFQENQRRDCHRYADEGEVQRCLERVDNMTYDRYQAEREEMVSETE
jgi:hypothetical protein